MAFEPELGYSSAPPYLEDPTIEGVGRFGHPDMLPTLEERELVENDDDWWRYSRFALPWLLICFLFLVAVFCLTFWQQAGNVKNQFDGVPRFLQRTAVNDSDDEGGMPKDLRNLRIAGQWFGAFGVVGALAVFFARPKPKIRKGLSFAMVLFLFVCSVLAWVAFGIGLDNYRSSRECEPNFRLTGAMCRNRMAHAIAAIALDACVGFFALLSAILLAYNTKANHWRLAPRGWEEAALDAELETPKPRVVGEMIQRNVSYVRKWQVGIALLATLTFILAWVVLTIVLHEHRQREYANFPMGGRGRGDATNRFDSTNPLENAGWPTLNTRLRYSAAAIGILTVLFNFLPFRSKTIAIVFGFLYFAAAVLLMVAFGFDVAALRRTRNDLCPRTVDGLPNDCIRSPFIATAVVEFLASLVLFIYIIVEYVIKGRSKCQHCERPYGVFDVQKHQIEGCSARPIKCDRCTVVMPAKEFVYRHRHTCGVADDQTQCERCGETYPAWGCRGHQEECPRMPVECTMCKDKFIRNMMPQHVMTCPNKPSACDACGETFRGRDIAAHRAVCGEVLVGCELCDDTMQRFRLQRHQDTECPKRLVFCESCGEQVPCFRWERHQRECGSAW